MKENLKNIFNLCNLFIKENDISMKFISIKIYKSDKKSFWFWIYSIIFFGIIYLSSEMISYAIRTGKPEIFLNGFLLFIEIIIIMKTIMISLNIFYFSKDIQDILHLPIKSTEILISKLCTMVFMNYEFELIFAITPLFIYGVYNQINVIFFINLIIQLIIFPLFATISVSIIMIILMKTIKLFKNRELMQIIVSFILVFTLMSGSSKMVDELINDDEFINQDQEIVLNEINKKIMETNKYFLNINPASNILQNNMVIYNYLKLFVLNVCAFLVFIYIGNKFYLKQLLKANFYFKNNKNKKINIIKRTKSNYIGISYIKKELKMLIKNPIFLIQCIYPVFITTAITALLIIALVPVYRELLLMDEYADMKENLKYNIEAVAIILGSIQIVGLFNYTSITSFTREGKNAFVIKILPISLLRQFIYKSIPQIFLNTICSFIIFIVINKTVPEIGIINICILFGISILLTIINSIILCLIDLLMPKLKWESEYEILKNNKNKFLQYVLIIFNILFFIFIKSVFKKINLIVSLGVFTVGLVFIICLLVLLINKYKNKLFKQIKY